MVEITLNSRPKTEDPLLKTTRYYKKADWEAIRELIRDAPWRNIFSLPAEQCANETTEWFKTAIEAHVPTRKFYSKPHSPQWFTSACAAAIAQRQHAFRRFNRHKSSSNRQKYIEARNNCKRVIVTAKTDYTETTRKRIEAQKLGTRDFWKIYNSVVNNGQSTIPPLSNNHEVACTATDKANLLASRFASNSTLDPAHHSLPDFPLRTDATLDDLKITPSQVHGIIKNLDTSKACGPDLIPAVLLKKCSAEVAPVLSKLYNKCLNESCFPDCWKTASVVPVFKNSGERTDPLNYRPISLLPLFAKIFESLY